MMIIIKLILINNDNKSMYNPPLTKPVLLYEVTFCPETLMNYIYMYIGKLCKPIRQNLTLAVN